MDEQQKNLADDEDKLIIEPIEPDNKTETAQNQPEKKSIEIPVEKRTEIPPVKPHGEPKEFMKYMCIKCKYKFTRKSSSEITLRCPYCGSNNVEEDTFDINQAIREVE